MADGLNRVQLLGNLGADPELRVTQGGQSVLNMRLAINESYVDKDKVRRERVEWVNIVCWGRRADALAKLLHKGSGIFVEGSIRTSSYDDRDGNKRTKVEINATNILLTGGRGDDHEDDSESAEDAPRGGGYSRGGGGGSGGGRPAGRSGGVDTVRFGRNNGQRFSEVEQVKDLEWYRDALEGNLNNPEKARYRDETLAAITALDEELARRGAGGGGGASPAPQRSGGYSGGRGRGRAPAPAHVDPEQGGAPGETYGEGDGGYGAGFDDEIPF